MLYWRWRWALMARARRDGGMTVRMSKGETLYPNRAAARRATKVRVYRTLISLNLPTDLLREVDEYAEGNIIARSKAIAQLLRLALEFLDAEDGKVIKARKEKEDREKYGFGVWDDGSYVDPRMVGNVLQGGGSKS